MGRFRNALARLLGGAVPVVSTPALWPELPAKHPAGKTEPRISDVALSEATAAFGAPRSAWVMPEAPPFAASAVKLALDYAPSTSNIYSWAAQGQFSEGIGFLGYAYLAELSQRPEYRRVSEIFAAEATRKWIKLSGNPDRIDKIEAVMKRLDVRAVVRRVVELDGFFGRGQIYIDLGDDRNDPELAKPLVAAAKIKPGAIKALRIIEPFWSYPGQYDSQNPLDPDFYQPRSWNIMASIVDASRLITIVGREMPDMLKPAYSFGGLALSQMIKPYVDNWLRTRQSVSDLLHSFSTMVLATDMSTILAAGSAKGLLSRLMLFNQTRDNRGVMAINKETEELSNVSTPLGTLDKLQAQAQEQIASVAGIPLVILLGVTPSGLNASSDGEVRSFYANVKSYQERTLRAPMHTLLDLIQLDIDGKIDPEIGFEFHDLWEMSETDKATIRKTDADIDNIYVGVGVVDNAEVRDRITQDEESPYFGTTLKGNDDLNAPPPTPEELAAATADDPNNDPDPGKGPKPKPGAKDALPLELPAVWLALDDQHWITVHPHGDDSEGQPVLIEGSAGGGYTIIGGAGGKLNGTSVTPTSMSGATGGGHRTHEEASEAAQAASNHAEKEGTSEAHEAAAGAHATAKEHSRVAGETDKEREHGKRFAQHKANARVLADKATRESKAETAVRISKEADAAGTEEAHKAAAEAQSQAAVAAIIDDDTVAASKHSMAAYHHLEQAKLAAMTPYDRAAYLADRATKHAEAVKSETAHEAARAAHIKAAEEASGPDAAKLEGKHLVAAEEHKIQATKQKAPAIAVEADRLSAIAKKEKTAEAHLAAMRAHIAAMDAIKAGGITDGSYRVHWNEYVKHRETAEKIQKKEQSNAALTGETTAALTKLENRFAKAPIADIARELTDRFSMGFRNGDNEKAYEAAVKERTNTYFKMTPEERVANEEHVATLRKAARSNYVGNVSTLRHADLDADTPAGKLARKTIGHVVNAFEQLEKQGFNIKEAIARGNVAFVPGSCGKYGGIAWQYGGTGHFNLSSTKNTPEHLAEMKVSADKRQAAGRPMWNACERGPIADVPLSTTVHELAHALGMQPHIQSPQKLQTILRAKFPNSVERKQWIENNISQYATKNPQETDAELCATVTAPTYVRGTLPKELEDHVDALFLRKG